MGKLIFSMSTSLDGFVSDEQGNFEWAEPDAEVHAFVNDLERSVGTYLFGRGMYETMSVWDTDTALALQSEAMKDFAEVWGTIDKIVYSRTLETVSTSRTRLEREFDADSVRRLKGESERDIAVAGPGLAAAAFRAGLVDECSLFVVPIIVGGGRRALPDNVQLELDLLEERRFDGGTVYVRYGIRR